MSNHRYHHGGSYMHPRMSYPHFSYVKYMYDLSAELPFLALRRPAPALLRHRLDTYRLDTVYDVIFNVSLVMIIAGCVIFVVSFVGCLGALRENTRLLKFYSMCLLMFFIMEMTLAIFCFVFPQYMNSFLESHFADKIIHSYRDDSDLQNCIDFAQQKFKCCGLSATGYQDWSKNE